MNTFAWWPGGPSVPISETIRTSLRRLDQTMAGGSPDAVLEPVDLALVKQVLRFTSTTEDTILQGWISAARQYFEGQTDRQILAATWEYTLDAFPADGVIELPRPPLLEVLSVVSDGTTMGVGDYAVHAAGVGSPSVVTDPFVGRGRVALASGVSWPSVTAPTGAVAITFTAGYGWTWGDIPELVKATLYDLVRHFHSRPDGDLAMTTQILLRMFRQSAIDTIPLRLP